MKQTIWCKHYRAMSEHKTCAADVSYSSFQGVPFDNRPCFCRAGQSPNAGCSLQEFPTAEEIAAEEAEFTKLFERTDKAREAIVKHLGGAWKRGMAGSAGTIDCPICSGSKTLQFTRSGYNGHIHAACSTENCVSWME